MLSRQEKISPLEISILFIGSAFGGGMLTLPRTLAEKAREDMGLCLIAGMFIMLGIFWCSVRLCRYFPNHTFIEYHRLLLGRLPGDLVSVFLITIMVMVCFLALQNFSNAVRLYLFDATPAEVIRLTLLTLAVYAGQYGLAPLVRVQMILFVPAYLLFIIITLMGLQAVDTRNLTPLLAEGPKRILDGALLSWFSFSGPELLIVLLYPLVASQRHIAKWGSASLAFTAFVYILLAMMTLGILGPEETAHLVFPPVIAFREVEIPATFFERLDGYILLVWIFVYFLSLTNFLFMTATSLSRLLGLEYGRPLFILAAPLIYYLSLVPADPASQSAAGKLANMAGLVWGAVMLPLLVTLAWFKHRRATC